MSRRAAGRHRRDQTMIVKRWTRYGKDRLYVSTEDGQRVGWLDLPSGESTVELPEFSDAFPEAISAFQEDVGAPGGKHPPASSRPQKGRRRLSRRRTSPSPTSLHRNFPPRRTGGPGAQQPGQAARRGRVRAGR